jgi:hypothetical protein
MTLSTSFEFKVQGSKFKALRMFRHSLDGFNPFDPQAGQASQFGRSHGLFMVRFGLVFNLNSASVFFENNKKKRCSARWRPWRPASRK